MKVGMCWFNSMILWKSQSVLLHFGTILSDNGRGASFWWFLPQIFLQFFVFVRDYVFIVALFMIGLCVKMISILNNTIGLELPVGGGKRGVTNKLNSMILLHVFLPQFKRTLQKL